MPFIFSDEEIEALAERISAHMLPILVEALKRKATMKARSIPPNLMSVDELAERLNTNRKWVYRKVKDGVIPGKKVGKFLMFEREEIESIIKEGRMF